MQQLHSIENKELSKEDYGSDDDKILMPVQVVNTFHHSGLLLNVFEESSSEESVNTCYVSESTDRFNDLESESCHSFYRYASSNCSNSSTVSNSDYIMEYVSSSDATAFPESFQHFLMPPPLSVNVLIHRTYLPSHTISTIPCCGIRVDETMQENVFFKRTESTVRGFGDGSDSSSDDDSGGQDKPGIHSSVVSHYHGYNNPQQHSLPNSPRYKSPLTAVNTSLTLQTSANTSHISSKHPVGMREAVTMNSMGMGTMFPKSTAMYTSKGEYLINDSLTERGPILLDIPNGRNELVMAAYSTQSIPKLYPIVGLRKELPGIALPPPIPLDLPKINVSRKLH